jgi:hypothetical protein
MRIPPSSMTFTLQLGFLVALPSFGIDMSLPALTAIGAGLTLLMASRIAAVIVSRRLEGEA